MAVDHQKEAETLIAEAELVAFDNPRAPRLIAAAQVHATLAVVEQLTTIANSR